MNLNGSGFQQLLSGTSTGGALRGLAIDYRRNFVYTSSRNNFVIKRATLDGSNINTIVTGCSDGLAFDWIRNRLYWADSCASEIEVYDLTAGFSRSLYTHSDGRVHDVAVDPFNGWLYWTHYESNAIYKGATDGSSSSVLHGNLYYPYAITLDHSSDRLFWSELTTIKSSLTDGSNLMTLMTLSSVHGLSVFEGILYLAKWNPSEARAVFVNSTDMTRTLTTAIELPNKIEVVSLFKQPLGCGEGDVRLVNGNSSVEGQVEVCNNNEWGTVCDSGWDLNDAHVVCRQLGFGDAVQALQSSHFGQGNGSTVLDNVACSGTESRLFDCPHNETGSDCGHSEEAGVICEPPPYLLVSTTNSGVYRMNLDGSAFQQVLGVSDSGTYSYVDFDYRGGLMYISSTNDHDIKRSTIDGSEVTTIQSAGVSCPQGLSFDWIRKKLYWVDYCTQTIEVYDTNSGMKTTLYTVGRPTDVAVDPFNGWLYWTDREDDTITKGKTDGSTSTILHNTDLNYPHGITLDLSSQRLFWADTNNQRIETSFTDGSNRMILIVSTQAWGLSIFRGILYWAQWNPQRVKVASVNSTNTNITSSLTSTSLPTGTAVVSKHKQPLTDVHGNCSEYTCTCNLGYSGDGLICTDIDECTQGLDDCPENNTVCVNTVGSYTCPCNTGFTGDDCSDIDECTQDLDSCSENAVCTNIIGSYTCACIIGFVGDGRNCIALRYEAVAVSQGDGQGCPPEDLLNAIRANITQDICELLQNSVLPGL